MSRFGASARTAERQGFSLSPPGQLCPDDYPSECDPLGDPIPIREVARILGVSPWTVRQQYLPQGLPHLRTGPQGKLVFFRQQVIRWILERQQKGGIRS
jgi:hypothetical protein